jgi:DNA-directed RNA polymerase specialized sigma24 family protein
MTNFNYLCYDLTPLGRTERRVFRLHAEHALAVEDIAEVFGLPSEAVARTLRRARAKYERTYRRLGLHGKTCLLMSPEGRK